MYKNFPDHASLHCQNFKSKTNFWLRLKHFCLLQLSQTFQINRAPLVRELSEWKINSFYNSLVIMVVQVLMQKCCYTGLIKTNICEISHKKLCDSSIMIKKASIYTMNDLNKSSEVWHSSSGCTGRPRIRVSVKKV